MSCVYGTYKACNKIVCLVHFTGKLVAQLEQELKRLQRRRTLDSSTVGVAAAGSREQPLFTLRQVRVCDYNLMATLSKCVLIVP